ncbi:MAG TPA: hypothetical protein V6C85_10120 [Allocoleopsis sp.]
MKSRKPAIPEKLTPHHLKANDRLSTEDVQKKIKRAANFRHQQKWLVVYEALVNPRAAAEIAQETGTSIRMVHQVISDYNRLGESAIEKE